MEASLWSTPVVVSSLKDTLWVPQVRWASDFLTLNENHLSHTVGRSTQCVIQSGVVKMPDQDQKAFATNVYFYLI